MALIILDEVLRLGEFQSGPYFPRESRAPNTYQKVSEIKGNSILSSVFVQSIDPGATILVRYFDTTVGASQGERFDIGAHRLLTDADVGVTIRDIFSKIHRRLVCEVEVVGGNAVFGVYATAVSSTASDIDSALVTDGEEFTADADKGIPIAYLDESTGKLFLVRGENGAIKITGTLTALAGGKTSPKSSILNLTNVGQEYPHTFRPNTVSYCINNEAITGGKGRISASWQQGQTSTQFFSIKPGQSIEESGIISPSLTIYMETNRPNTNVSITEWT